MTLGEKAIKKYREWLKNGEGNVSDLLIDFAKEIISDKEKEIEELHRELEDYTFNYPDFKAENEQLKADLEKHKQSELATGKLLLAEKQKTESLQAQMKEIKIICMNKSGGCYHCDNFDCKEIK